MLSSILTDPLDQLIEYGGTPPEIVISLIWLTKFPSQFGSTLVCKSTIKSSCLHIVNVPDWATQPSLSVTSTE